MHTLRIITIGILAFPLIIDTIPVLACTNENVTLCTDKNSCHVAEGFWFNSTLGCIPSQGVREYIDNEDDTITDVNNKLIWQKSTGHQSHWFQANSYCENLVYGGSNYSDWRLPTKDELKSLVVCTNGTPTPLEEFPGTRLNCNGTNVFSYPPAGNYNIPTVSPIFESASSVYWAEDFSGSSVSGVSFDYGTAVYQSPQGYGYSRCVRSIIKLTDIVITLKILTSSTQTDSGLKIDINGDQKISLVEIISALQNINSD